jgi:UDP-glucose 4-epimerase
VTGDDAPGGGQDTVLVTGGTGYLGSLAVEALVARGARVVSVDVRPPAAPRAGVVEVTGDVRALDLAGLCREHEIGAVVHLAAIVDPPRSMSEETLHAIEVGGTERVLTACVEAGVSHVTVTSSGAAYGYHPANLGRWIDEDDPVRGSDAFAYSRHKAEVERLLARAQRLHPELAQLVLRPGTILGVGTRNLITRLFTWPVVLGLRGVEVPFVFVWDRDVAEIVARGALERRTGTWNVAGDGVVTLADVARLQGKRLVRVPVGLLTRALTLLRRLGLSPYGPEQVDFLRYRPVLGNTRLKRALPGLPTLDSRGVFDVWRGERGAPEDPWDGSRGGGGA